MCPEDISSQRLSMFLDDFLFANSCGTVPFLLRKVCSSTCVGPSVLTRESTWETQLDNLNHSNVGFKHIVATPGDNARCHPEFPGSYSHTRSRFADASLKSLPRWDRVRGESRKKEGTKKRTIDLLRANRASSNKTESCAFKRTSDFIRRRSQLGACRAAQSTDRSTGGRPKGDRTKREDSRVKKKEEFGIYEPHDIDGITISFRRHVGKRSSVPLAPFVIRNVDNTPGIATDVCFQQSCWSCQPSSIGTRDTLYSFGCNCFILTITIN